MVDMKGDILECNQAYLDMLGYTKDEVTKLTYQQLTPIKWYEMEAEVVTRQIIKRGYSDEYEKEYIRKDGTVFPITLRVWLVKDEQGTPVGMWGIIRDITERKQAEESIKNLNKELEQRLIDLTSANKELEAFSYSVSHDLRAPIRHIAGFVDLLMQNTAQTLDERSVRYLNIISDSTKHMGHLIDDILSFSRMGRAEMKKSPVNLDQIVKEAMKELQTEMKGRDIAWNINSLPEVHGGSAMLKLVWVNLIGNALKFTRTQPQARIEIGWNDNKDELIFYIKDNGVGFDMAYVDKLFNLFQRLHRKEGFEGTGVGLANIRRIIQRHGGKTWAEGKVNEGATFYFSLPRNKTMEDRRQTRDEGGRMKEENDKKNK
jgi:PAS domain S-box-containing protein